jgi:hypothetical protein
MRDNSVKSKILSQCRKENNTLYKCILCKHHLSSNQWSIILQEHLKNKFNIGHPIDNVSGDGLTQNKKNVEIKVSLGDVNGQFHFVQLRPDHKVDSYLFMVYNLNEHDIGKLYYFVCNADEVKQLIVNYGDYAHGTKTALGPICHQNLHGRNSEYSLRPHPLASQKNKQRKLWNLLVENFCKVGNCWRFIA